MSENGYRQFSNSKSALTEVKGGKLLVDLSSLCVKMCSICTSCIIINMGQFKEKNMLRGAIFFKQSAPLTTRTKRFTIKHSFPMMHELKQEEEE